MFEWLLGNLSTILVSIVLLAVVAWIIYGMIKDKKQGKSSCGGNCSGCAGCAYHRPNTDQSKTE